MKNFVIMIVAAFSFFGMVLCGSYIADHRNVELERENAEYDIVKYDALVKLHVQYNHDDGGYAENELYAAQRTYDHYNQQYESMRYLDLSHETHDHIAAGLAIFFSLILFMIAISLARSSLERDMT